MVNQRVFNQSFVIPNLFLDLLGMLKQFQHDGLNGGVHAMIAKGQEGRKVFILLRALDGVLAFFA